jgi:hypothetical protein
MWEDVDCIVSWYSVSSVLELHVGTQRITRLLPVEQFGQSGGVWAQGRRNLICLIESLMTSERIKAYIFHTTICLF